MEAEAFIATSKAHLELDMKAGELREKKKSTEEAYKKFCTEILADMIKVG